MNSILINIALCTQLAMVTYAAIIDFSSVSNQVTGVTNQIAGLSSDIGGVSGLISGVTNQISGVSNQIGSLGQSIDGVTGAINGVTNQVSGLTNQFGGITSGITQLSGTITQGVGGVSTQVGAITGQIGTLGQSFTQGITGMVNQVGGITNQIGGVTNQLGSLGTNIGDIMTKSSDIGSNLGNVMNVAIPGLDTKLDSILGEGVPLLDGKLDGLLDIVEKLTTMAVGEGSLENEVEAFADTIKVCFIQLLNLGDLAQVIEDVTGFSIDDVTGFAANIPDPTDIVFRVISKIFLKHKSLLDFFCTDGIRIIMELADKWLGGGILPIDIDDNTSRRRMSNAPESNCANLAEDEFCERDGSSGSYSYENPQNTFYIGSVNGLGSATSSSPLIPDPYDNSDTNEYIKYKKVGFILYLVEEVRKRSCNTLMNILGNELLKMAIPGAICEAIGTGMGYADHILGMTLSAVDVHDGDVNNVRLKAVFRDRITIMHNQKMLSNELETLTERINSEFNFSTTNVNDRFDLHLLRLEQETNNLTDKVDYEFDESTTNINNNFQTLTSNMDNKFNSLTITINTEFDDSTTNIDGRFSALTARVDQEFTTSTNNINNKFHTLTQKVDDEFETSTTNINTKLDELTERVDKEFNISTVIIQDIHDLQMTALQQGFVDLVGTPQGAEYTLTKIKESLDTVENKLETILNALLEKINEEFTASTTNVNEKMTALTGQVESEFQTLTTNINNKLDSVQTAVIQRVDQEFDQSTTNINNGFNTQSVSLQEAIIDIVGSSDVPNNTLTKIKEVVDKLEFLWYSKWDPHGKHANAAGVTGEFIRNNNEENMVYKKIVEDGSEGMIVLKIRPFDLYVFGAIFIVVFVLIMAVMVFFMIKCVSNNSSGFARVAKYDYETTDVEDVKQ